MNTITVCRFLCKNGNQKFKTNSFLIFLCDDKLAPVPLFYEKANGAVKRQPLFSD